MNELPSEKDRSMLNVATNTRTFLAHQVYQDRLLTSSMGGVLPERGSLDGISRVLDVACGSGGWALDVARWALDGAAENPDILEVVGIDINQDALDFAKKLAVLESVSEQVQFLNMDVRKPLAFSDHCFDLVNIRMPTNFMNPPLLPEDWPAFVQECRRVARSGGIVRITEFEMGLSNSLACQQLFGSLTLAYKRAGMSFSPDGRTFGFTPMLRHILLSGGMKNIEHRCYGVDASFDNPQLKHWRDELVVLNSMTTPFVVQMGVATQEERAAWIQQGIEDMEKESYCCMLFFVTAWGIVP